MSQQTTILPQEITNKNLDYLCDIVQFVSITIIYQFENSQVTCLSDNQFREISSKLKNSIYPLSLIVAQSEISDKCAQVTFQLQDKSTINIKLWKALKIELEGNFKQVFSILNTFQQAFKTACYKCSTNFKELKPIFVEERLDNIMIGDGIRMRGSYDNDDVDEDDLLNALKLLKQNYGSNYQFQDGLDDVRDSYKIDVKVIKRSISKEKSQLRKPVITITNEKIKIIGCFSIIMYFEFRQNLQECFKKVTGKDL